MVTPMKVNYFVVDFSSIEAMSTLWVSRVGCREWALKSGPTRWCLFVFPSK